MSGMFPYAVGEVLPAALGGPPPARPASMYLALLTALAKLSDTGSTLSEPSFAGYARPAVPFSVWGPIAPGSTTITNVEAIALPSPSSGQVTIVQTVLVDALVGGNIWWGMDTYPFLLDAEETSPAIPENYLVVAMPWMGTSG